MKNLRARVIYWIEHRTGLESAIKNFSMKTFRLLAVGIRSSVALHSFYSLQGFTGVLLSFNYAPTPGEAYNSLKFIITELTGGRLIRGLHHWGASLMIVIVFLHMTQVFLYGAYKKPREVLPLLLEKRKGRIINISSVAGKIGITYGVAYTASKHGLLGLTRALATEVASHDITTPPSPWG